MCLETPLTGGNVADSVVRVGETVRKPAHASTPAVDDLLSYLLEVGFEAAPRPLGRDNQGRQVLEYVPGKNALDELPRMDVTALARVGALIRRLHDATADYQAPAWVAWEEILKPDHGDEWVCHNDLAPWNLIVGDDER